MLKWPSSFDWSYPRSLVSRTRSEVFFTTTAYSDNLRDAGLFVLKVPSLAVLVRGSEEVELDPRLERRPRETLIEKQYASAFFGTALASELTALSVDTLIVSGATTSGCIRATVVDALQHGAPGTQLHDVVRIAVGDPVGLLRERGWAHAEQEGAQQSLVHGGALQSAVHGVAPSTNRARSRRSIS